MLGIPTLRQPSVNPFDYFSKHVLPTFSLPPHGLVSNTVEERHLPLIPSIPTFQLLHRCSKSHRYRGRTNCFFDGCSVSACCGTEGGKREFCSRHALAGMVRLDGKGCIHPGCLFEASYGIQGGKSREFCARHASEQKVATLPRNAPKRKSCLEPGCSTSPSYGEEGTGKRDYCSTHARQGMTYRGRPTCSHPECSMSACCGVEGSTKAEFCTQHALPGMARIGRKNCIHAGCFMEASYSLPGRSQREVCRRHSTQAEASQKTSARHAINVRLGGSADGRAGEGVPATGRGSSEEDDGGDMAMGAGRRQRQSRSGEPEGGGQAGGRRVSSSQPMEHSRTRASREFNESAGNGSPGGAAGAAYGGDFGQREYLDEGQQGNAAWVAGHLQQRRSGRGRGDGGAGASWHEGSTSFEHGSEGSSHRPPLVLTPQGWIQWDWDSALANARR